MLNLDLNKIKDYYTREVLRQLIHQFNKLPGISSSGNLVIKNKKDSFTLDNEDIVLTSGTNAITATLPESSKFKGKIVVFKHTGTQPLTIKPTQSQLIEGATSSTIAGGSNGSLSIFSDGDNWWIIN